jgi:hypothetical protein
MPFVTQKEKRQALRFLTQQRKIWTQEMSKYDSFEFVIGIRVRTESKKYVNVETHWCGDKSVCDDFTDANMFGGPIETTGLISYEEEPYTVPSEDLNYPGSEDWVGMDLSPHYNNIYQLATKARTLIRFAWWQEYKHTPHGKAKQPYSYVADHPELLFSWWTREFPDIPFTTLAVGRRDNAKRIVSYIHKRYVLKDMDTLQTQAAEGPSPHDVEVMISNVPQCDPIHLLQGQPVVYDMAYYQKNNGASRKDTYKHFGMNTTQEWESWAAEEGEALWSEIVDAQIDLHKQQHHVPESTVTPDIRETDQSATTVPSIQKPRKSSRYRKASSTLHGMVTTAQTKKTISRNTKNVRRR